MRPGFDSRSGSDCIPFARSGSDCASAATPLGTFDVSIMHDRLFSAFSTRFSYICGLSTLALNVCSRAACSVSCLRARRRVRKPPSSGVYDRHKPYSNCLCRPLTPRSYVFVVCLCRSYVPRCWRTNHNFVWSTACRSCRDCTVIHSCQRHFDAAISCAASSPRRSRSAMLI